MPTKSKLGGLSEPLFTLDVPDPNTQIAERSTDLLEDIRYIGSYDWAPGSSKQKPAIVVPGAPNVWSSPVLPLRVVLDDVRKQFRDRGGYMLPGRPLLPLVAAVNEQRIFSPEDWKTVDFVTDRNGLRKLLRWVTAASGRRDFRIDTQLVGEKTVILNRWEPSTIGGATGNPYGLSFEKTVTSSMLPGTQRSDGHHRIVTYRFGRSRLVVQFEVDGCLSQDQAAASTSEKDDEDLVDAMASLGLPSPDTSSPLGPNSRQSRGESIGFGLKIHHRGNADVPHSSILEMRTSSSDMGVKWGDQYPQLYFSQTENFFSGYHKDGEFHQIDAVALSSPRLQTVNTKLQPALKKLEEALRQIQSIVIRHGKGQRLSLVYEKPHLTVHRRLDGSSCLPAEALALFD